MKSSSKSRWIKFFGISLLYMLLVIADNILTYLYTPDLTMEANPLASLFGLGWKSLLIEDVFAVIIFSFFAYFPFVYYERPVIQCKGFKEYISILFFERPDKFKWFFIKSPKKKMLYLFSAGYTLSIMSIILRLLVVLNNISCIINFQPCLLCFFKIPHTYHNMIQINTSTGTMLIPIVLIAIIVVLTIFVYYFWFFNEYKINKKALDNLRTAAA